MRLLDEACSMSLQLSLSDLRLDLHKCRISKKIKTDFRGLLKDVHKALSLCKNPQDFFQKINVRNQNSFGTVTGAFCHLLGGPLHQVCLFKGLLTGLSNGSSASLFKTSWKKIFKGNSENNFQVMSKQLAELSINFRDFQRSL